MKKLILYSAARVPPLLGLNVVAKVMDARGGASDVDGRALTLKSPAFAQLLETASLLSAVLPELYIRIA